MQTVKEAITILQEKKQGLINYHSKESFICITVSEMKSLLSLLSKSQSDEEGYNPIWLDIIERVEKDNNACNAYVDTIKMLQERYIVIPK